MLFPRVSFLSQSFFPYLSILETGFLDVSRSVGFVSSLQHFRVTLHRNIRTWHLFPFLPGVFATFHFASGWGFLKGSFDFIVLRKQPAHRTRL